MSLQTMYAAVNNSPQTALAEGITADATSMTLLDASVLAEGPNICVIGTDDSAEIVSYTAITDNVVSGLVRGINGTVPKVWETDTIVARNMTAYDHEAFRANIIDLDTRKADTADLGALADHDTVDYASEVTGKPSFFPPASHTHDERYYTESETADLLAGKSDTDHIHDNRYYTESEVNTLLSGKSDTSHNHDSRYYTETETNNLLAGKSDTDHNHDDRYYTETEADALLTKYLSAIPEYAGGNIDIDTMTNPTALVQTNASVNASLYNAIGSSYAYVIQLFYGGLSASRNHIQIAFPYGDTTKMAWRVYSSGWKSWQVVNIAHVHDDRYYTEAEIDTKLAGKSDTSHTHSYLPLSGGTLTGNLNMSDGKYVIITPSDTTNLKKAAMIIRSNERLSFYQYPQNNSYSEIYQLPAVDTSITSHKYYFILTSRDPVTVAQGGTGATTAANALSNLGAASSSHNHDSTYVKKAGDTMTGALDINTNIRIHDTNITYGTPPASDVWGHSLQLCGSDNSSAGIVRTIFRSSGINQLHLGAMNKNGSTTVENYIRLGIKTDGTMSVAVGSGSAWRDALGLTAQATAADSGWIELTNSSVFDGKLLYRKVGNLFQIKNSTWIKLKAQLNAGGNSRTLAQIPSTDYRPSATAGCFYVNSSPYPIGAVKIESGNVVLYNCSDTNITTSMSILLNVVTYMA